MTHLDISEDLATEIAAARFELMSDSRSVEEKNRILDGLVQNAFPVPLARAVASHSSGTEEGALTDLVAFLTIRIEGGFQ